MRISISNIAWDTTQDDAVSELLSKHKIDAIDIAPGKYFPDPVKASDKDIAAIHQQWNARGVSIVGMQSLLFGTQGLNVFGDDAVQKKMLEHLRGVMRVAAGLGIKPLVFGSPKNRDRQGLSDEQTRATAHAFFSSLGDMAQQEGVVVCLEPNPECYGANFMTCSAETLEMVELINHPAIKMQLDTGAIKINQESVAQVIEGYEEKIGHIHLSEPNLAPLGRSDVDHQQVAAQLNHLLPGHVATIEMLTPQGESSLSVIEQALLFVTRYYRDGAGDMA